MLYLESPAGVGFSYGPTKTSDDGVAVSNLNFLVNFFDKFAEY